jgi:hypothetical protein
MRVSETPTSVEDLDLMKLLEAYGNGSATWRRDEELGTIEKAECQRLHSALTSAVKKIFGPILDRISAREMRTFTMHDSVHGLKVSHLMWHIIDEKRRSVLTPPEIAMLVVSAHLHDLGMGLISDEERCARLAPASDLWNKVDAIGGYKKTLEKLESQIAINGSFAAPNALAINQLAEAQDLLLCLDCRERHASRERYNEILNSFREKHHQSPTTIPLVDEAIRFGDDSFISSLIEVCVSHNEDASVLLEGKKERRQDPRFPTVYPIDSCTADLRFVAATLRLADILDFDRERVPAILFHYLLPRSSNPAENISVREWQKHMTISNWDFSQDAVIFRGRSNNPVAHHAVVEFCKVIETEIRRTNAVFRNVEWPFNLCDRVSCEIHSEGFTYLPYRFELSQEKIFSLLMGRSLYGDAKAAIRELLQNSVDACLLRDALVRVHRPSLVPSDVDRISVTLQEAGTEGGVAKLIVEDTGTGMDQWIIENYFLKVGDSYYRSVDFLRTNAELWQKNAGFNPTSEFGIGFLSCFMLASKIEVQTAMPTSPREDSTRRNLNIDGLGRLISVSEFPNTGYEAVEGTRVTLHLDFNNDDVRSLSWSTMLEYIQHTCVGLPYSITLRRTNAENDLLEETQVSSLGLSLPIPEELNVSAIRMKVGSPEELVEGEVILFPYPDINKYQQDALENQKYSRTAETGSRSTYSGVPASILSRGGFSLGEVPGLPRYVGFRTASTGILRLNTSAKQNLNQPKINIPRTRLIDGQVEIEQFVLKSWLEPMIINPNIVKKLAPQMLGVGRAKESLLSSKWLEEYSALQIYKLARALAVNSDGTSKEDEFVEWECGEGNPIWLGTFDDYVSRILWELVLPPVCTLITGEGGSLYVGSPISGWIEALQKNYGFVSSGERWSHFSRYTKPIDHLLYYSYPSCKWLSDKYQELLSDFSDDDFTALTRLFDKLVSSRAHTYLPNLTVFEITLLNRVVTIAPDALIGGTSVRGLALSSFLK